MSREDRHIKSDWGKRIYSYLFGNLPEREKNALERESQKDLFLSDALEGLENLSRSDYLEDIKSLEDKLDMRTKRKILHRWMAVAATIIFIGGISFLLFLLIPQDSGRIAQNRGGKKSSVVELQPGTDEETVEPVASEEIIATKKGEEGMTENKQKQQITRQQKSVVAKRSSEEKGVLQIVDDEVELDEELGFSDVDEFANDDEAIVEPVAAIAAKRAQVFDSSRKEEVAAYSIVANDQDRSAAPEMGMERYKVELELRINKLNKTGGRKIKATIELTISPNGRIDKVDVLRLSEKGFNDELIRIIQDGPAWIPAIRDGLPIEDKVKFKIFIDRDKRLPDY